MSPFSPKSEMLPTFFFYGTSILSPKSSTEIDHCNPKYMVTLDPSKPFAILIGL